MEFKIRKLDAKEASRLSVLLKDISCVAEVRTSARNGEWRMDAKSILGLLAISEASEDGTMLFMADEFENDDDMKRISTELANYMVK